MIKYLVQQGADVKVKDSKVIRFIARIKQLIHFECTINWQVVFISSQQRNSHSCIDHMIFQTTLLQYEAVCANLETIKYLVDKGLDPFALSVSF